MKLIPLSIFISIFPFVFQGNNIPQPVLVLTNTGFFKAYRMINEGQALVKEGDLIVRMNQDPLSQFIKNFNRHDKRYSHSGIVLFENGYPYVYHMVSGDENPDAKIKKDSLFNFCAPEKNFGYGIYRYSINSIEAKQLKEKIHQWQKEGVRFDSSFNLRTDEAMYCSELVKKAIAFATKERIKIATTTATKRECTILASYLHLSSRDMKKFQLVAIDDLYMNPHCSLVRQYNFFN